MGLTKRSVGLAAVDGGIRIERKNENDRTVAVAGNPNVGKSTLFNTLTGMKQHTGNWPGKTVASAAGTFSTKAFRYTLVDIPGTYSLLSHSPEEEVARNFLCFSAPDATLIVCDATCLVRNLNLVLQVLEIAVNPIVCVNLLDEAKRKGIRVDLDALSALLDAPVIGTVARNRRGLAGLTEVLDKVSRGRRRPKPPVSYPEPLQSAIARVAAALPESDLPTEWLARSLIENDPALLHEINLHFGRNLLTDPKIASVLSEVRKETESLAIKDIIVQTVYQKAEEIGKAVLTVTESASAGRDRKIDRLLTGRAFGIPAMLLLLLFVFWLTMAGANYPSAWLSALFGWLGDRIFDLLCLLSAPKWLQSLLLDGVYNVLTSVISVMLPPMAIFFPLFTLLEDVGYLPRVAYNLDRPFSCCHACGKQALSMCMGFGCNAAGVVGCRIIDSPRERLIAILTNSFVPCNGRFPMLVTLIGLFLLAGGGALSSLLSALLLTACILLGIGMTFLISALLSATVLRGMPSSFVLELPPYRKPQIGRILVRSVFDRTLFVLGRAAAVAAPAGLILWLCAHIQLGGQSFLITAASALDPIGRFFGIDGAICIAFLLGFPANEIVLPILVMLYAAKGSITALPTLPEMRALLFANGWTVRTAVCTLLFSLFHWPCSTTLLTVHKETGSLKWTLAAAALPTAVGLLLCALVAHIG